MLWEHRCAWWSLTFVYESVNYGIFVKTNQTLGNFTIAWKAWFAHAHIAPLPVISFAQLLCDVRWLWSLQLGSPRWSTSVSGIASQWLRLVALLLHCIQVSFKYRALSVCLSVRFSVIHGPIDMEFDLCRLPTRTARSMILCGVLGGSQYKRRGVGGARRLIPKIWKKYCDDPV